MSVALRRRDMSGGRQRLFLDYYHDGHRQQESLRMYVYKRPRTEQEKSHNKEALRQANSIRSMRELEQNASENGIATTHRKSVDFLVYFQSVIDRYKKKNIRALKATLDYLKEFVGTRSLTLRRVNEQLCIEFRDFLELKLSGETPYDYFAHFKRVLKQAKREGLLTHNPASDVISKRTEGKMKDDLTIEELKRLAAAHCGNQEVKRAFLFACYSGLRTCDLRLLKWKDIRNDNISLVQSKTGQPHTISLHPTAKRLLGEPGKLEEPVFNLPSQNGINKVLKNWVKRAKVDKHITFHCARVSFGTNLAARETDILAISSALGHRNLRHTKRYVKLAEERKQQVVNKLPGIDI